MSEGIENREGQVVMPFYIICDVSGSMVNDMADLKAGLSDLHDEIMKDAIVSDLVMLSVITFDTSARTVVPLAPPPDITLPSLSATGSTNYSAAFQEFHRAFQADRARLKGEGKRVNRPCIFFLTDGEPNDDSYIQTFRSLLAKENNPAYPYVCAFGYRSATEARMKSLAYPDFGEDRKKGRWFIANSGKSIRELFKAIAPALAQSIVGSAQSVPTGAPSVQMPGQIPGMTSGMAGSFV